MSKKSNHVVPSNKDGWGVKKSGASKYSKTFEKKSDAIEYGRELSRKEHAELFIHKKNGVIQNRNSYGNDPHPPKDKKG